MYLPVSKRGGNLESNRERGRSWISGKEVGGDNVEERRKLEASDGKVNGNHYGGGCWAGVSENNLWGGEGDRKKRNETASPFSTYI